MVKNRIVFLEIYNSDFCDKSSNCVFINLKIRVNNFNRKKMPMSFVTLLGRRKKFEASILLDKLNASSLTFYERKYLTLRNSNN